jgi:hypothetical protein
MDCFPLSLSFFSLPFHSLFLECSRLGVIQQDCGLLCAAALSNPTAETLCTYACDAMGIYEFIQYIESEDLDPIYYCEVLDMCPIDDCSGDCMDIIRYVSVPTSAKAGTFRFSFLCVCVQTRLCYLFLFL